MVGFFIDEERVFCEFSSSLEYNSFNSFCHVRIFDNCEIDGGGFSNRFWIYSGFWSSKDSDDDGNEENEENEFSDDLLSLLEVEKQIKFPSSSPSSSSSSSTNDKKIGWSSFLLTALSLSLLLKLFTEVFEWLIWSADLDNDGANDDWVLSWLTATILIEPSGCFIITYTSDAAAADDDDDDDDEEGEGEDITWLLLWFWVSRFKEWVLLFSVKLDLKFVKISSLLTWCDDEEDVCFFVEFAK